MGAAHLLKGLKLVLDDAQGHHLLQLLVRKPPKLVLALPGGAGANKDVVMSGGGGARPVAAAVGCANRTCAGVVLTC
jgi:hypothetical protein